MAPRM